MRSELLLNPTLEESPAKARWVPSVPAVARDAARLLLCWALCVVPAVVSTRYQYTWSLLIFIAPLVLTTVDLHRRGQLEPLLKPVGGALALLVPMGAVLTVGLADDFFTYPATHAVLGLTFPAVGLDGVNHAFQIPIEELAFYVLGFASLLMLYAWADAVLVPMARAWAPRPRIAATDVGLALSAGMTLGGIGWLAQGLFNPTSAAPAYWLYLMLVPAPVVIAVGPHVAARINWPALTLVSLALWGHSILWEVTLAVPQGWWGYQRSAMIGLHLDAWHGLPIEAVVVWLLTPIATVISFELLRARITHTEGTSP